VHPSGRLYDFSLSTVDAAARLLYPAMVRIPLDPPMAVAAFPEEAAALAWLDAELPNLVDGTAHAAAHGRTPPRGCLPTRCARLLLAEPACRRAAGHKVGPLQLVTVGR
jgi:hypothetical protein